MENFSLGMCQFIKDFLVFRAEVLANIPEGVDPSFMQELTDDLLLLPKNLYVPEKVADKKVYLAKTFDSFLDKETGIISQIPTFRKFKSQYDLQPEAKHPDFLTTAPYQHHLFGLMEYGSICKSG